MAVDPRKKQRKLQKQKAKKQAEKKAIARQRAAGLRGEFERASAHPVYHSCEFLPEFDEGITQVLISRRARGQVAFACFLIDSLCLGVKDITAHILPEADYSSRVYDKLNEEYECLEMSPADVCKFVEGAIAYAAQFGLPPAPEWRKVQPIFNGIDPEESTREFEFGHKGKPHYIAGPYDSPAKINRIMAALHEHCGEGNYDYTLPMGDDGSMFELP